MIRAFLHGVTCAVAGALVAGCGYSTQSSLPPEYQTIAVSPFYDHTPEFGLQAPLTNAVTRKFIHDSRLEVVHPDQADLLLEGVILNYQLKGLTYDENDRVTQYLLVITAGVRVTDLRRGEVLWEDELMAGETSYYTRAAGQSSDRLRGNAEVFLPTVRSFASDEENRAAAEALEQLASDIFYRTVEPWPAS
ncbi:MAG: LptE family protein [Candidatus Hydrogenedentes bacterium]|nr:LptE family protein [Candidatus Hydrogenedentota bacterium]